MASQVKLVTVQQNWTSTRCGGIRKPDFFLPDGPRLQDRRIASEVIAYIYSLAHFDVALFAVVTAFMAEGPVITPAQGKRSAALG